MKTSDGTPDSVAYYPGYRYSLHEASIAKRGILIKMNGARRVIIFCLLTAVLPTILIIIPLYLRHNVFNDVVYEVAESDVLELGDDISTIFCQDHTLKMNTSFSAYQVYNKPEINNTRKHIRLKKSMRLPDDTLEYWGFYLLKGSTVRLSVCSRYEGSHILVVRGEKNLRTCGLLDHSKRKGEAPHVTVAPRNDGLFRVRFEMNPDDFQPLDSNELPERESSTPPLPLSQGPTTELVGEMANDTNSKYNETSTRRGRSLDTENNAAEDETDDDIEEEGPGFQTFRLMREIAREILPKRDTPLGKLKTFEETVLGHKLRHARSRMAESEKLKRIRRKAGTPPQHPHNLDAKVVHGGNAQTHVESDGTSEMSSFEKELLDCYGGDTLLTQAFTSSSHCVNVSYLLNNNTGRMTTTHQVNEDGYYYYIFYSDNDFYDNDIHAVFDIYKPTYQLANITKKCENETTCTFPVAMFSNEIVIIEVPTKDGIEHEEEDLTLLISVCEPRMAVYIIFPLLVLMLILGCAFL